MHTGDQLGELRLPLFRRQRQLLAKPAKVAAGHEAFSRTTHDNRSHCGIAGGTRTRREQSCNHFRIDGVQRIRTIERQDRDTAINFIVHRPHTRLQSNILDRPESYSCSRAIRMT